MEKQNLANEIAQFIIEDGTENTSSGNWGTDFEDIEVRFGISNMAQNAGLLTAIANELGCQEEVQCVDVDEKGKCFDTYYSTLFCPSYEDFGTSTQDLKNIVMKHLENQEVSYYLISTDFPLISTLKQSFIENEGQIGEYCSSLKDSSYYRLENQFGRTIQYMALIDVDTEKGRIVVEYNPAFFDACEQAEQPMDFQIPIAVAKNIFEQATEPYDISSYSDCQHIEELLQKGLEDNMILAAQEPFESLEPSL